MPLLMVQSDWLKKIPWPKLAKKMTFSPWQDYLSINKKMKVKLTLAQLKKILQTEEPKYPITIFMAGIDKEELEEVVKILKAKKKS